MKILLSAFACEPDRGSEYAVGWNWALSLVRAGHDVVVLTCSEARPAITRTLEKLQLNRRLRCEYFDVPKPFRWKARGPLHLHSALWQWMAVDFAKELHKREKFDRVHHVTYAGLRIPSFMGRLGIPFVFGPVGGGERAPWRLRWGYSLYGLIHDAARDAANALIPFMPFLTETLERAERIYVTSSDTLRLLPRQGGERFQAGAGRPPRSLKKQFQQAGVPGWARQGPLLYAGDALVFVPGLGLDARAVAMPGRSRVTLRWEPLAPA